MDAAIQSLINAVEKADSSAKLCAAVANLAQSRHEAAIPTLSSVLAYNNPGAAVAAVEGLIAIGEAAVPYLLENLDGYNYGARAWATRAFAGIGDPRALDLLIESALSDFSLSVRRAAARGLGTLRWLSLTEDTRKLRQQEVLDTLTQVSDDLEWVVRYAAVVGLQGLGTAQGDFLSPICDRFDQIVNNDQELVVKARAKKAKMELYNRKESF